MFLGAHTMPLQVSFLVMPRPLKESPKTMGGLHLGLRVGLGIMVTLGLRVTLYFPISIVPLLLSRMPMNDSIERPPRQ